MPIRASMPGRLVRRSTGCSKAMSRATNHMRSWPASVAESGLVAGVGLEQTPVDVVDGGAADVLVEAAGKSGTGRCRSMAPKPSTVPIRVRALMVGSGAP